MDAWRAPQAPTAFDSTPLYTLDGERVTLAALSEEEPLLIYFWATWCGVCRYTTPDVARLQAQGEKVLTIALRSGDEQTIARWLARKGISFPVVNDANVKRAGGFYDQRLDQLLGDAPAARVGENQLSQNRGNPVFLHHKIAVTPCDLNI